MGAPGALQGNSGASIEEEHWEFSEAECNCAEQDCFYDHSSPKAAFETDTYCIGFFRTKMHDVLLVN